MNCKWVEKQLMDEGAGSIESSVHQHVQECPKCRDLYREVVELEQLNQSLKGAARAPDGFASKVALAGFVSWIGWRAAWASVVVLLVTLTFGDPSTSWGLGYVQALWNNLGSSSEIRLPEAASGVHVSSRFESDGEFSGPYVEVEIEPRSGAPVVVRIPAQIEVVTQDLHPDVYLHQASY